MRTRDEIVKIMGEKIARMEGFYGSNTPAARNMNPGNLRPVGKKGFVKFKTVEEGWAALYHQIDLNIGRGLTFREFFGGKKDVYKGYAPSGDGSNYPEKYAAFVAEAFNVPIDRRISWLFEPDQHV